MAVSDIQEPIDYVGVYAPGQYHLVLDLGGDLRNGLII